MNRQDLIKEYADYGFTVPEICAELNLEAWFVYSALHCVESDQFGSFDLNK